MPDLNEFLVGKARAMADMRLAAAADPCPIPLAATAEVKGGSGVREVRMRDFQIITDAGPAMAGFNLGPNAPEVLLGALASCIVHTTLILAADDGISLDAVSAEVTAEFNVLAQRPGFEHIPIEPQNLSYKLNVSSTEYDAQLEALHQGVRRLCPIFNLILNPQRINGELVRSPGK